MQWLYFLIALAMGGVVFLLLLLSRKTEKLDTLWCLKGLSLMQAAVFFFRYLSSNFEIEKTLGLNQGSPFGPLGAGQAALAGIVMWLGFLVYTLLVTYPFFKKGVKCLTPLMRYVGSAVYIICFFTLPLVAQAMDGEAAMKSLYWRDVVYALEVGLGLGYTLYLLVFERAEKSPVVDGDALEKTQTGSWWQKVVQQPAVRLTVLVLLMAVVSMPLWIPQLYIGYIDSSILPDDFNLLHRLTLYGSVLVIIPVYFLFSKREYEERRYALLYFSFAAMIAYSYNYTFENFGDVSSWPLHLCNTAMYIIPLCLMFKWDKLYYFTMFINVLGAFFAMIMPNVEENLLSARIMQFWQNHYCAFLFPILVLVLDIFPRPKLKQFIYSLVAFAVYFASMLLVNAWLTNYNSGVDFFFLNSDFVAEKLGQWAEDLRDIQLIFYIKELKFVLYPVYQALFFLVYVLLSLAMWFLYEQAFEVADLYKVIRERNRKIRADQLALEVSLAGRDMREPIHPENQNKLILRHFCKRYSTSDVYAVYDASLEIEGGQIFGFLGPNGAGKSTIIKSIVGIQTITSGEIEAAGYDMEKQSVDAKMQIGFVPDHYALYENLTGREYVNYIADLYGVPKEERDARIASYVERFNLGQAIDNPIKTYSHGMKQKITIMAALVHNPKIWILDEPLTGLDPESIFQVKECMKEHAQRGNIVFFSSHIIDVVERICDKIAIIRRGQILCTKTIAEIEASGIPLEKFYMDMIENCHDDAVPAATPAPTPSEA